MQGVGEIRTVFGKLECIKFIDKCNRRFNKLRYNGRKSLNVFEMLIGRNAEEFADSAELLFVFASDALADILDLGNVAPRCGRHSVKRNFSVCLADAVPRLCPDSFKKTQEHFLFARQEFGIFRLKLRLIGKEHQTVVDAADAVFSNACHIRNKDSAPGAFGNRYGCGELRRKGAKPDFGKRICLRKRMQRQNRRNELLVVTVIADEIRQAHKVFGWIFIEIAHNGIDRLSLENIEFIFIKKPEIGSNSECVEILTHKVDAEGVNRADICTRKHKLLTAQTLIRGIFGNFLADCRLDFFLHLCRGGFGKGYDKQIFNSAGIFGIADSADNSFNKHRRFARACRRTYKQRSFTGVNGFFLVIRPIHPQYPPLLQDFSVHL